MTRDQDYTRDRLIECRGPATVDDGDEVTFVYQRPDGSQYDRQMVFRLLDAGQPNQEAAA